MDLNKTVNSGIGLRKLVSSQTKTVKRKELNILSRSMRMSREEDIPKAFKGSSYRTNQYAYMK